MGSDLLANTDTRNAEAFAEGSLRPFSGVPQCQYFPPLGIRQFAARALFSPQHRLGMQAHAIPIPTNLGTLSVGFGPLDNSCEGSLGLGLLKAPTFGHHVLHVVSMGTKEEMCRINAGRDIAGMKDKYAFVRPSACFDEPTGYMGTHVSRFVGRCAKVSIASLGMRRTLPQPAVIRTSKGYFAPKTVGEHGKGIRRASGMVARRATVFPGFGLVGQYRKRFSAEFIGTDKCDVSHGMTSLYGQSGVVRLPHGQGPRRTLSGGATSNLTNARVYSICSHARRF